MDKEAQEKIAEARLTYIILNWRENLDNTMITPQRLAQILMKVLAEEFGYRKLPKGKPQLLDIDQYLADMGWIISRDGMQYAWLKQALERQKEADIEWYEKGEK